MASIDGAYYFLTALVPVRRKWDDVSTEHRSAPIIELREKLARMPTAMQTPWSAQSGEISPFSHSTRTHFARFAVIDRLGYNGYVAPDPVASTIGLQKATQTREELARPYLLFAAEFDAPSGSKSYDLAVYLRELWDIPKMREDLVEIFSNCVGFDPEKITTAAQFISYIRNCEIETTMPFNYYWMEDPKLPSLDPKVFGAGVLGAGLLLGLPVAFAVWWFLGESWWTILYAFLAAIIPFLIGAVAFVAWQLKKHGDRKFAAPPDADLISVLKSLHLQTSFGRFVIDHQASDASELHDAFGAYLDVNKPGEAEPRHPAGRVYP